ncbi:MAG: hypothetical protein DRH90_25840, partial [Deltaproteobacteria bacterium]
MIYKTIKISISLFIIILLSAPAVMANENFARANRAMNKAGFTENQRSQVEETLNSAQKHGLPEDVISDKLQEGIAKNVAPEKIVHAVKQISARYNHAHSLAKGLVNNKQEIAQLGNIVAAGMAAGLTTKDAEKIMAGIKAKHPQPAECYSLAKETMMMARDLSRRGIVSGKTAEIAEMALQKSLNAKEMRTVREDFNTQQGRHSIESVAGRHGLTSGMASNASDHAAGMGSDVGSGMGGGIGSDVGSG